MVKSFAQGHSAMPVCMHRGLDFLLSCNRSKKVKELHVSLYRFEKKMMLTLHVMAREQSNVYFCQLLIRFMENKLHRYCI